MRYGGGNSLLLRSRIWFQGKPPAIRNMMLAIVGVYLVWVAMALAGVGGALASAISLDATWPGILLRPWQVVTYVFGHFESGFWGLIYVMFVVMWLAWMGEEYESTYGARKTWTLFLGSALAGGIVTIIVQAFAGTSSPFANPTYGAVAPIAAFMSAAVATNPTRKIGLFLLGIVSLKVVLLVFLALDFLSAMGGQTFFLAHVGAALFGYWFGLSQRGGYARASMDSSRESDGKMMDRLEAWLARRQGDSDSGKEPKSPRRSMTRPRRRSGSADESTGKSTQQEVDRILDKISEGGYDSLSASEKRTLYEASRDD